MLGTEDRKATEKRMHDIAFSGSTDYRKKQEVFYSKDIQVMEFEYIFGVFGNLENKKVLLYGVGDQASLVKDFVDRGAYVVAIDISSEAVNKIKAGLDNSSYQDRSEIMEMDCEELTFEDDSFDAVFGRGIIHHLDLMKSFEHINRVLRKNGKVVFVEPLASNPLIQIYRALTPKDRTPDEHPLKSNDLRMFDQNFDQSYFKYLYALTLLSFIVRIVTKNETLFLKSFGFLKKIDDILLNIPGYKLLCWDVILVGEKTT